MRFWDSSALVPLLHDEQNSSVSARLSRSDPSMVVWAFTRTEALSALRRKVRLGHLDDPGFLQGRLKLEALAARWLEVKDLVQVRGHAERFLGEHPLRAADALQLGAAWHHVNGKPNRREFVVFDGPLLEAAEAVGFEVVSAR